MREEDPHSAVLKQQKSSILDMDMDDDKIMVKNICFIGAGHVGAPSATVLAFFNPNLHVTVVDNSKSLIQKWNRHSTQIPLHDEAGLATLVRIVRDGTFSGVIESHEGGVHNFPSPAREPNLVFSSDVEGCIAEADMVFICVGTPTARDGLEVDTEALAGAVKDVAIHGKNRVVLVMKSTVPVGMAGRVAEMIEEAKPGMSVEVLSNPEFLAEGEAVKNLLNPDRVLIGSASTRTGEAAASALVEVYTYWTDPAKIQRMSNSSAELVKLAANAMLAQRISSMNAISAICEETDADIKDIERAIGSDSRIGPGFLQAGIGFGGSCFKKDILSLSCLADSLHLSTVSEYWKAILRINDDQCDRFVQRVASKMGGSLPNKKVVIFGWAFKKGISDSRESRSINILEALLEKSVGEIAIVDPRYPPTKLEKEIFEILDSSTWKKRRSKSSVFACEDPYEACHHADAVLILTDWDHFCCPPTTPKPLFVNQEGSHPINGFESSSALSKTCDEPSENGISLSKLSTYQEKRLREHEKQLLKNPKALLKPEPLYLVDCNKFDSEESSLWSESGDQVDWSRIATMMKDPRWVFDGRDMVDVAEMTRLAFRVEAIGKASAWQQRRRP